MSALASPKTAAKSTTGKVALVTGTFIHLPPDYVNVTSSSFFFLLSFLIHLYYPKKNKIINKTTTPHPTTNFATNH
jgi:hypothetical protein